MAYATLTCSSIDYQDVEYWNYGGSNQLKGQGNAGLGALEVMASSQVTDYSDEVVAYKKRYLVVKFPINTLNAASINNVKLHIFHRNVQTRIHYGSSYNTIHYIENHTLTYWYNGPINYKETVLDITANPQPDKAFVINTEYLGSDYSLTPTYIKANDSWTDGGYTRAPYIEVDYTPSNVAPNTPSVSIDGVSSDWQWTNYGGVTVRWNFSDPDSGDYQSRYRITGYNQGGGSIVLDTGEVADTNARSRYFDLWEGDWQFAVQVCDSKGVWSPVGWSRWFHLDRTLPTVSITSPANNFATKDRRIPISWSYNDANAQKSYFIEIINNAYNASLWNSGWIDDTNARSYLLPDMGADIAFYLRMSVKDQAGNISGPIEATNKLLVVDNTPPSISSVQGYSYTNQTTGTRRVWFYSVTDGLSGIGVTYASYNKPGGANSGLTAYASGVDYYVDVPLGPEGEYVVYFQAVDRAGNASATVYAKFFVDSQRPNDPNASAVWGETDATFTWGEFSDPYPSSGRATTDFYLGEWNGSSYVGSMLFNGQDIGNVTSKYVSGLKPGTRYRYTVTYHDKAGNESSYTYREFVTKKKVGEYRIGGKNGSTIVLPIYDPASGVLGSKALREGLKSGGGGCFELVTTSDVSASPLRVSTPQGIRSISK